MIKRKKVLLIVVLFISLFGGFYEFTVTLFGVIYSIYLWKIIRRRKYLSMPKTSVSLGLSIVLCSYILSIIWSADKGIALLGVLKVGILFWFWILWNNLSKEIKQEIWDALPASGAIITAILFAIYPLESVRDYFYRAGRLGGTFQYSNTYALFLLLGIIILIYQRQWQWKERTEAGILLLGIVFSGSRSVLALTVGALGFLVIRKHIEIKKRLFWLTLVPIIWLFQYFLKLDIGRLLKFTINSSTLNGRLLYWSDAFPILVKHPFGLGYMGYYFLQPQFQTGNYVTKFVHNDILQIGLDAGIIAMISVMVMVVYILFQKRTKEMYRVILLLLFVHSMFDFDLQFIIMPCMGLMCMVSDKEKEENCRITAFCGSIGTVVVGGVCIYFTIALGASYVGQDEFSLKLYPLNTFAREAMMAEGGENEAEKIIVDNGTRAPAYEVAIKAALEEKDYIKLLEYTDEMLRYAGYDVYYYNQSVYYLSIALDNTIRAGDIEEAQNILEEIQTIPKKLKERKERTSKLAYRINDSPDIELDEEIQNYLEELSGISLV